MKKKVIRRAVKIAAVIMYRAGLCRHEDVSCCGKPHVPTEDECIRCIESWALSRARQEIRREESGC